MNTRKNKTLNRKIVSSSISVIISLSLVLFVVGLLSLILINTQRLSNYVKENVGFSIMIKEKVKEIELIEARNKPTWIPPQPFLNLGVKTRLMYERLRASTDI